MLRTHQVALYPPGIPLLVQGEVVTKAHMEALWKLRRQLHRTDRGRATTAAAEAAADVSDDLGDASEGGDRGLPSGVSVTGCADRLLDHLLVYIT